MLQLPSRKQTFKRSCYRRPGKDYLAEMYRPGVLYSLTLFLLGILDMRKDGVYFDGSNTTNRILDALKEERPQMLIYKQQNHIKVTLGERDEFECI